MANQGWHECAQVLRVEGASHWALDMEIFFCIAGLFNMIVGAPHVSWQAVSTGPHAGLTPMGIAVESGSSAAVRLLLSNGANVCQISPSRAAV